MKVGCTAMQAGRNMVTGMVEITLVILCSTLSWIIRRRAQTFRRFASSVLFSENCDNLHKINIMHHLPKLKALYN